MSFSLAGKSILIVDDYATMRKATRDMLYTLGADNITEADSGVAAINMISKHSFDVVLCDYNLGTGKTGQQVLEEVRLRKLLPYNCIFVIISAEQATSMVLGAMDGKPDEYIAKPFNPQQLASRLQRNFARKEYLVDVEKEIARGNTQKAIRHCDRLLAAGDKKMYLHLLRQRAELAITVGDFDTAGKIYHEILSTRDLPWAKLGLGIIEFQQNHIELAVAVFEQLVRDQPLLMEGYDWLSRAYERLNKMQDLQDVLFQAVDLSPHSILRQKKLATTAEKNGNLDVAAKAYQASVRLGKNSIHKSSADFAGLAKLYTQTNDTDAALKTLNAMRNEFANNAEAELRAVTLEVELYKKTGNEEQATLALQKVLDTNQKMNVSIPKELQLDIIKTCFLSDQAEKAEEMLNNLINSHVDDDVFLNDVRRMQSSIGMDNHSEIVIQRSKQALINTNNKGVALYKQGKLQEALEVFDKAIATMPDNKTIILNMLKIMIHDLKYGEINEDKLLRAKNLLKKATQIGVDTHKLGILKMEFSEAYQQHLSNHQA